MAAPMSGDSHRKRLTYSAEQASFLIQNWIGDDVTNSSSSDSETDEENRPPGTLMTNRKGVPVEIKSKKGMKRGDIKAFLVRQYHDSKLDGQAPGDYDFLVSQRK
ncbi:hypothetical protein LOTGIDRAFT_175993 [Lottia gigantea]|uniref:Uncharacterized protein n=1 Tax=Lottia gigantea TaxID=225164 RepID=V3ZVU3_LOTGI|nr:hypothetical protein LOTGIDRAFT_175993 [Lottia gigantea]ESO86735.1 hypothetical protein LOTGIDRAFT_175993 [Lottia gigantea]